VALFHGVSECGVRRRDTWGGEAGPQQYESTYFPPVHSRLLGDVNSLEEVFNSSGAVHERIQMNANAIEQREVEVGQVRSLLVPNMPAALQAGCGATCDQDRKVFVIVKAGITHAAAVQVDRVIEERAVTIGSGLHSL